MKRHEILTVAYVADGDISAYRIVKPGSADGQVTQSSADDDKNIGVCTRVPAGSGERVEIVRLGIAPVEYGADVAAGELLTADADGKATPTTTAAKRYVGVAEVAGAAGDIGSVLLAPALI